MKQASRKKDNTSIWEMERKTFVDRKRNGFRFSQPYMILLIDRSWTGYSKIDGRIF